MTRTTRKITAAAVTGGLAIMLSGCGFVNAGHRDPQKPSGFVLFGHADVPLATSGAPAVGSPCTSPVPMTDVRAAAPVRVTDAGGTEIASGSLREGVTVLTGTAVICEFPFEVHGVPGNSATYGISVSGRPPQSYPADALKQSAPAVVTIVPAS